MVQFSPDELSLIRISGHIWLKMLKDRERKTLDKMYGLYCNGATDFMAIMSEYATVRGQIHELELAITESNRSSIKDE